MTAREEAPAYSALARDRLRPKVLVVDDDPYVRLLLEDMLTDEGFDVLQAQSASGLTEVVREQQPDIVILDEIMEPCPGSKRFGRCAQAASRCLS